jgi:L-ribulose-5-phosphate 4-epimerase
METGLVVIKASGIRYEKMRSEHMVVVDMDGNIVEGNLKPSSDTASHLYIYKHRLDVGGVVHTHSAYATAFAAVNKPIPVVLTAIADEFGGPIPCGGFALIGDEAVGRVVEDIKPHCVAQDHRYHWQKCEMAVRRHRPRQCKTVWLLQIGTPDVISDEDVEKLHHRYTHVYGQ